MFFLSPTARLMIDRIRSSSPHGPVRSEHRHAEKQSHREQKEKRERGFPVLFRQSRVHFKREGNSVCVCIFPAKVKIFDGNGARLALGLNTLNTLRVSFLKYCIITLRGRS